MTPFLPKLPPLEPNLGLSAVHGTGEERSSSPSQSHQPVTQAVEAKGQVPMQTTGLPQHTSLHLEAPGCLGWRRQHSTEVNPAEDCHTAPTTILLPPSLEFPVQGLSLQPLAPMFCPGHASPQGKATSPASPMSLHNHPELQGG